MDSTDLLNSENDIAGRMEAASLADTPRPMGETGPAPRYTPFEPTRQVAKAKDETAERIRMDFEEFIERFVTRIFPIVKRLVLETTKAGSDQRLRYLRLTMRPTFALCLPHLQIRP
jgi:hypothetical protein